MVQIFSHEVKKGVLKIHVMQPPLEKVKNFLQFRTHEFHHGLFSCKTIRSYLFQDFTFSRVGRAQFTLLHTRNSYRNAPS